MRTVHALLLWPLYVSFATAATANDEPRAAFFGTWGTSKHCARDAIKPGGTVRAAPYEIGPTWLRHGQLWCALSWGPVQPREMGVFSAAHARCGEDAVRNYFLRLSLHDGALTMHWAPFLKSEPLGLCP